jgi:hypothetical protein
MHAEFWQASDTVLVRDVALTLLLDDRGGGRARRATELVGRALRFGQFESPGCARLLDVMRNEDGGFPDHVLALVVTEWVPGRTLTETISAGPLRTARVLSVLEPLVAAAVAAHRQGLVLGCGQPQRIRVAQDGGARLTFVLPRAELTPADDVRGLGAVLYALLTGHWPLQGPDDAAGLPAAPRDVQGVVLPPGVLRPGLPVEVSALAQGALGADGPQGTVHTAAAVHTVISELLAAEQEVALLPPPHDGAVVEPDEVWRVDTPPEPELDRKRKLSIGMGGLGLGLLAVIGYVGVQVGSLLGVTPASSPRIVVNTPPAATRAAAAPKAVAPAPPAPLVAPGSTVVSPTSAKVFDLTGDPDNADQVGQAVDGNPATSWSTYDYRQPFPALKPGVGIMVSFATPVQLSSLIITSPSTGSQLQIRSAPSPQASFAQTIQIGTATIGQGGTTVSLTGSQPVQNVLIWITKLGGGGDQNITQISDLRFERVTG